MTKPDGGQAFPRPPFIQGDSYWPDQNGMSLRDWFAGQALAGLIAGCLASDTLTTPASLALEAYATADAMITERNKL